ncbi:MAG: tRNA 2-selenouridine(34) synthase MnmH [Rikenellaceae bacterium]
MKNIPEIELPELTSKSGVKTIDVDTFLSNPDSVILDIRSPSEYSIGHIERARSFPLFTDEERAEVGTIYKKIGKEQAIEKGLEFVGKRLHLYVRDAKAMGRSKEFYLYCWRGGMRSRSMAWLLSTAGFNVSLLSGGYKAYRQSFETYVAKDWKFISILGGTGSGKTELLNELEREGEQVLDLEGLANHKGSVFGGFGLGDQPSTEEFINRIHNKLRSFDWQRRVWVEGESIMVGSCFIPNELYDKLIASPYFVVEMSMQERVERLTIEYGSFSAEMVEQAFVKVSKRMGYNNVREAIDSFKAGDVKRAVELALIYYDKGYSAASEKRTGENIGLLTLTGHNHREVAQTLKNILVSGKNFKCSI